MTSKIVEIIGPRFLTGHLGWAGKVSAKNYPENLYACLARAYQRAPSPAMYRSHLTKIAHRTYMVFRYSSRARFWSALNVMPHR
jgi:hypothetical protein